MKNDIRRKRMSLGMTQTDLAKKAEISRPYLSEIEKGKSDPTVTIATRIARVLGTKVESIFLQKMSYKVYNEENENDKIETDKKAGVN